MNEAKQNTRQAYPENWIYKGRRHPKRIAYRKVQEEKGAMTAPLSAPPFSNVKKVISGISIFYTNADQLMNKIERLQNDGCE